jgi:hypothetical protein
MTNDQLNKKIAELPKRLTFNNLKNDGHQPIEQISSKSSIQIATEMKTLFEEVNMWVNHENK